MLSGFAAGATGTAMNCWTDVLTLGPCVNSESDGLISGSLDSPVPPFHVGFFFDNEVCRSIVQKKVGRMEHKFIFFLHDTNM